VIAVDAFDFATQVIMELFVRVAIATRYNAIAIRLATAIGLAISIGMAVAVNRDVAPLYTNGRHLGDLAATALKRRAYPADAGHGGAAGQATRIEPVELL
jgi:hypothetical protein